MKIEYKNGMIFVVQNNTLIATLNPKGANSEIASLLKKVRKKAKETCVGHSCHNFLLSNGGKISFKGDEDFLTIFVDHPLCSWGSTLLPLDLHLEALDYTVTHLSQRPTPKGAGL